MTENQRHKDDVLGLGWWIEEDGAGNWHMLATDHPSIGYGIDHKTATLWQEALALQEKHDAVIGMNQNLMFERDEAVELLRGARKYTKKYASGPNAAIDAFLARLDGDSAKLSPDEAHQSSATGVRRAVGGEATEVGLPHAKQVESPVCIRCGSKTRNCVNDVLFCKACAHEAGAPGAPHPDDPPEEDSGWPELPTYGEVYDGRCGRMLIAHAREAEKRVDENCADQRVDSIGLTALRQRLDALEARMDKLSDNTFNRDADLEARIAALEAINQRNDSMETVVKRQEREIDDLLGMIKAQGGRIASLEEKAQIQPLMPPPMEPIGPVMNEAKGGEE